MNIYRKCWDNPKDKFLLNGAINYYSEVEDDPLYKIYIENLISLNRERYLIILVLNALVGRTAAGQILDLSLANINDTLARISKKYGVSPRDSIRLGVYDYYFVSKLPMKFLSKDCYKLD